MNSLDARILVIAGYITADGAVDAMCAAGNHEHAIGDACVCPECGALFARSDEQWNTCSNACQVARNTAIFELDGGRSIIRTADLTAERLGSLLSASGLPVEGAGKLLLS